MGMTAVVQTGLARVGDLRIAYESVGTGDPALLFIHGAFQDRSYFAGQQTTSRGAGTWSHSTCAGTARAAPPRK